MYTSDFITENIAIGYEDPSADYWLACYGRLRSQGELILFFYLILFSLAKLISKNPLLSVDPNEFGISYPLA